MSNVGKVEFATLVEVYADTLIPTGITKPNDPMDPDYIAPYVDLELCPIDPLLIPTVNSLHVTVENYSTQTIVFKDLTIRPGNSSILYYSTPIKTVQFLNTLSLATFELITEFTALSFEIVNLSKNRPIECTVFYKRHDVVVTTTLYTSTLSIGGVLSQLLNTDFATTSGISDLRIVFNDIVVAPNIPPSIDAGLNQTITTTTTTLTGSIIDPDSSTHTITWSQVSGPNAVIINTPNSLTTSVSGLLTGSYIFKLTVKDDANNIVDDIVRVDVTLPSIQGQLIIRTLSVATEDAVGPITLINEATGATLSKVGITGPSQIIQYNDIPPGTYTVLVQIAVASAVSKSLSITYTGSIKEHDLMSGTDGEIVTYCFENIPIFNNSIESVILTLRNFAATAPLALYKLSLLSSVDTTLPPEPILPNGEFVKEIQTRQYRISTDFTELSVPSSWIGTIKFKRTDYDVLAATLIGFVPYFVSIDESNPFNIILQKDIKVWDYTANNPLLAEIEDLVEHKTFTYELLPSENFIIE